MRSLLIASVIWTCVLSARVMSAPVPDALQIELKSVAEDIARIVEKNGGGSVAIGEFTGSADVQGHAGPRIQLTLAEELKAAGLTVVTEKFQFEVTGKYVPFEDTVENRLELATTDEQREAAKQAQGLLAVRLVTLISLKNGEPLAERPTGRLIFGAETVPALLGLSTSGPPLRDPQTLSDNFKQAQEQPQANTVGTQLKGKTGQYALAVLVKRGGEYQALPLTTEQNHPFVELQESDLYGLRLINNSPHEAAVDLRIDGVNCFAFSDTKSQYWIIPAHSHLDVIGWHRNQDTVTEFKVVKNFPETAAAKLNLKPSASIGLITVSFSASWENEAQRPADEPAVQGRGTGFGNDVQQKSEEVARSIGQVRDNLAVRYER